MINACNCVCVYVAQGLCVSVFFLDGKKSRNICGCELVVCYYTTKNGRKINLAIWKVAEIMIGGRL